MTLDRSIGVPLQGITSVIVDAATVWLGTRDGILGIPREDCEAALARQPARVRYSLYDRSDGLAGLPLAFSGNRRVVRTPDDRIWFVTSRGLTVLDPRVVLVPRELNPVRIETVIAGDETLAAKTGLELRAGTSRLAINYTVLDLTPPLRTRFRYRLEGFDKDWIDADARRQAFYTNLPPRKYQFRVVASAGDNRWAEPVSWEFSIKPMFYETTLFYLMVLALGAAAVWAGWQLRLRRMRRQFSVVLAERTRLSREIHDTLLQSLVGVALQFDAIASDLESVSSPARAQIVRMRKLVEERIREARQSILGLRSPKLQRMDLASALREAGDNAIGGASPAFEFAVTGTPAGLSRRVEEQLLRIGEEAVLNATRHAGAVRIRMTLGYEDSVVRLVVADDGKGFDPGAVAANRNGHYGLVSMQERAEEAGGQLEVRSGPSGTDVIAMVPLSAQPSR